MKQKIVAFDLDDVICQRPLDKENLGIYKYDFCEPIPEAIRIINSLHDNGIKIIIYTARGMSQFNSNVSLVYENLYEKTTTQLCNWGVKFDKLVMGKIHYDLLVDDKAMNSIGVKEKQILDFVYGFTAGNLE